MTERMSESHKMNKIVFNWLLLQTYKKWGCCGNFELGDCK